jgi:hypothetical protein
MIFGLAETEAHPATMFQVPTMSPPQAETMPHDAAVSLLPPLLPQPMTIMPIAMHAHKAFMKPSVGVIIAHLAENDQSAEAPSLLREDHFC